MKTTVRGMGIWGTGLIALAVAGTAWAARNDAEEIAIALRDFAAADPVVVSTSFSGGGQFFALNTDDSVPTFIGANGTYSAEFPMTQLYRCRFGDQRFQTLSRQADCEGLGALGPFIYVFAEPFPGLVPLYRYVYRTVPTVAKGKFERVKNSVWPKKSARREPAPAPSPSTKSGTLLPPTFAWVTTDPTGPELDGFKRESILGYVFSVEPAPAKSPEKATWIPVYAKVGKEKSRGENNHLLTTTETEADDSFVSLGVEFHVSKERTHPDDAVLYRTFTATEGRHLATLSERGYGGSREFAYGYISKKPRSGFVPLYRHYNKKLNDRWVTVKTSSQLKIGGYVQEAIVGYVSPKGVKK